MSPPLLQVVIRKPYSVLLLLLVFCFSCWTSLESVNLIFLHYSVFLFSVISFQGLSAYNIDEDLHECLMKKHCFSNLRMFKINYYSKYQVKSNETSRSVRLD